MELAVQEDLLRLDAGLRHALVAIGEGLEAVVVLEQSGEARPGALDAPEEVADALVEVCLVEGGAGAVVIDDLAGLAPDLADFGFLVDAEVELDVLRGQAHLLVDVPVGAPELVPGGLGGLDLGEHVVDLVVESGVLGHVFLFPILTRFSQCPYGQDLLIMSHFVMKVKFVATGSHICFWGGIIFVWRMRKRRYARGWPLRM